MWKHYSRHFQQGEGPNNRGLPCALWTSVKVHGSSIIMLQRPNIWRVSVLLLPLQLPVRVPAPPVQTVREDPTLGVCRPVNAVNVVVGASSGHCESPVATSTGIVLLLPCYLFIVDICSSTAWGPSETFWPTVVDSQQQSQQQCNC